MNAELEALLLLTYLPRPVKARLLIQHYGSAKAAVDAPLSELTALTGSTLPALQSWKRKMAEGIWQEDLRLAEQLKAELIPYTSPCYPQRLLETVDHPLMLYVQGELRPEDQRSLAVVGTRRATIYGQEIAQELSRQLAQAGLTVVSGLARGIDTAAHQGALERGRTIAVLGSGLSQLYPAENKDLAKMISQQGAVISEYPMSMPPAKHTFPQRNRLVSGMTLGTILVEAPQRSGALLTAAWALSQNRPVFAVPGRVDQESFRGNHALIKAGQAELVENAEDILKHFRKGTLPLLCKSFEPPERLPLNEEEEALWRQMPPEETPIEALVGRFNKPVAQLNVLLMSLVLKKRIKEYPGKIYKKI